MLVPREFSLSESLKLVFHTPTCVTVFVRQMIDKWENRGFLKGQEGFGANYEKLFLGIQRDCCNSPCFWCESVHSFLSESVAGFCSQDNIAQQWLHTKAKSHFSIQFPQMHLKNNKEFKQWVKLTKWWIIILHHLIPSIGVSEHKTATGLCTLEQINKWFIPLLMTQSIHFEFCVI